MVSNPAVTIADTQRTPAMITTQGSTQDVVEVWKLWGIGGALNMGFHLVSGGPMDDMPSERSDLGLVLRLSAWGAWGWLGVVANSAVGRWTLLSMRHLPCLLESHTISKRPLCHLCQHSRAPRTPPRVELFQRHARRLHLPKPAQVQAGSRVGQLGPNQHAAWNAVSPRCTAA